MERNMKISINISKDDAQHLKSPHHFFDEMLSSEVLYKVQGAVDKELNKPHKRRFRDAKKVSFWASKSYKTPVVLKRHLRKKIRGW
jgi:hypothetical protein